MQAGVASTKIQRLENSCAFQKQKETQCDHRARDQGREWQETSMREPSQAGHLDFMLNIRKATDTRIFL